MSYKLNLAKYIPKHSSMEHIVLYTALGVIFIALVASLFSLRSKANYLSKWKMLQKLLGDKSTWKDAIIEADKLLDMALKNHHYKGRTTGERLVAAQHELSANDKVWFSHKLANKIVSEKDMVISKSQVKKALLGFWQALRDLDAFGKKDEAKKVAKNE